LAMTPASDESPLHRVVAWAIIGIFVLLFGATLYLTREVLVPLVAAAIIGTTLGPLNRRAGRHHVPPWLFALLIVGVLIAVLHISTLLFFAPISKWIERAPEFGAIIKDKLHAMDSALATFRGLTNTISQNANPADGGSGFKIDFSAFIEPVLGFLTPAVSQLIIFLAALFFVLVSQADLRRSLILLFSGQDARLRAIRIMNDVEEDLARYAATVTVINFGLGCLTALGTAIIGLPSPVLWGILAFLCYVGPALVLCILFGVGLINFSSFGYALVAPALYVALTTAEGHFITPNIVGQRFTLSPLAVFLALVFWTWLWGPVGGFLAVPILIVGIVTFNHLFSEEEVPLPG
jgi:predicted PurR-regulated permease PerM